MMRKDCLLGLLCLFATGCFSHGPYGHPGAYAPPHTAMATHPYGMVQVRPGTAWVPSSPAGSTTLSAPEPASTTAPTSFDTEDETNSGKSVPEPTDLKRNPRPEVEPAGLEGDASLERRGVKLSQREKTFTDEESADSLEEPEPELALTADDELRLPTTRTRSAEFTTQVRSNNVTPAGAAKVASDKFGYDAEGYSWLKGIIEFNPKQQVWHLTYSQNPDDTDQFGGEVTLKNTVHFKYLRSGETVRVEGKIDSQEVDRRGKPVYEVVRMIRDVKR